ncbi:serine/threonine-protein kinase RsbT [Sphaerotilus hippei]|uniref:Serine/threonine-protein kinase RsbT n=1 Tax=Sphaerotilus hippei TaxID=744406 RepID=A0A318GX38_9BURK|nr:ATP-binding protein [Sphaerotilus hippei]PXW94338.1 serine/threonine-protein kinase RsbT [Sphaerotilus hippei]
MALPLTRPDRDPSGGLPVASHLQLTVQRESDVPQVVAAARQFCLGHGFTPLLAAHVATAASELANNLWMHTTRGGVLRLRLLRSPVRDGVELLASDDGPGIADITLALSEGYSTGGGMGCGLPGVQRLMDEFELVSEPGAGTRVCARKWSHAPRIEPGLR